MDACIANRFQRYPIDLIPCDGVHDDGFTADGQRYLHRTRSAVFRGLAERSENCSPGVELRSDSSAARPSSIAVRASAKGYQGYALLWAGHQGVLDFVSDKFAALNRLQQGVMQVACDACSFLKPLVEPHLDGGAVLAQPDEIQNIAEEDP